MAEAASATPDQLPACTSHALQGSSILFVTQPAIGGSARHMLQLARWCAQQGMRVEVFCDPAMECLEELSAFAAVRTRRMQRWPTPRDALTIRSLRQLLRAGHFHLVHAHSSKAGALVRLSAVGLRPRPKVLYTPHLFSFRNPELPRIARLAFALVERALARWTDAVISLSPDEERDARRVAPRALHFRTSNGVPPCPFDPVSGTTKKANRLVRVGYVGRLAGTKGVDTLLEALALVRLEHSAIVGLLVGDGPDRKKLEQLTARLGLASSVRFLGWQPNVLSLMEQMDIMVFPSRAEAQNIAAMEAMSVGRAIVATDVYGLRSLFRPGIDALLVPPDDPPALARAILTLAGQPDLRRRLGTAAREAALSRFTIDRMLSDHAKIYASLLKPNDPAHSSVSGRSCHG